MGFHTPFFRDPFWDLHLSPLAANLRRGARGSSCHSCATVQPSYKLRASSIKATLQVELPGVPQDAVSVQVEGNKLVIKGTRYKREPGSCAVRTHKDESLVECRYLLEFTLGESVDKECVKADCCGDGLLFVTVPFVDKVVKIVEIGA